jgi:hypothetical protein
MSGMSTGSTTPSSPHPGVRVKDPCALPGNDADIPRRSVNEVPRGRSWLLSRKWPKVDRAAVLGTEMGIFAGIPTCIAAMKVDREKKVRSATWGTLLRTIQGSAARSFSFAKTPGTRVLQ